MQTLSVDQLVGKTVGDYQIERLLSHGRLSAIYLARQRSQDRSVMITTFTLPETLSAQARERFIARFSQEGSALVKLQHPNILPTYDLGIFFGSPYLVTAFVQGASLAQILAQQTRFTPEQTLTVLRQITAAMAYAHNQGCIHGLLNPASIVVNKEQSVQVTGFGLRRMCQIEGIVESAASPVHLYSLAGTFLGAPAYLAPEYVRERTLDARADVYAVGMLLFELLSGTQPYTGAEPLRVVAKCLQQPVPSLHGVCPDVPAAFDLVIYRALEREPDKRYASVGEALKAFERVLNVLGDAEKRPADFGKQTTLHSEMTLPPTVNWFDESSMQSTKWQLKPPVVTEHTEAVKLTAAPEKPVSIQSGAEIDPFAWWAATSSKATGPLPGTFTRNVTQNLPRNSRKGTRRKASLQGRRQVVGGLIATGSVVALLGLSGVGLARLIQSTKPIGLSTTSTTSTQGQATTPATHGTHGTQSKPTPGKTSRPQPAPTKATQPSPTPQATQPPRPTPQPTQPPPQPTPTPPPPHTGTVIGSTSQAVNSGKDFTNPADGNSGLLVRLPNGKFVACERACTHQGVKVNYDPGSHTLICPAHGAVFDPANGFSVTQGPANSPLPNVAIRVNADGTITTG